MSARRPQKVALSTSTLRTETQYFRLGRIDDRERFLEGLDKCIRVWRQILLSFASATGNSGSTWILGAFTSLE